MEITDVRVKLVESEEDRLRASCTITIDGEFVIRDVKVIEGSNGLFVAMPSRKLTDHCPKCRHKNHLRARFCNSCGTKLNENRSARNDQRPVQLHAEIAHPINSDCRDRIQSSVLDAFMEEYEQLDERSDHDRPQRESGATEPHRSYDRDEAQHEDGRAAIGEALEQMDESPDDPREYDDLINELKSEARDRSGSAARRPPERSSSFDTFDAGLDDDFSGGLDAGDDEQDDFDDDDEIVDEIEDDIEEFEPQRKVDSQQAEDDFGAGIL